MALVYHIRVSRAKRFSHFTLGRMELLRMIYKADSHIVEPIEQDKKRVESSAWIREPTL